MLKILLVLAYLVFAYCVDFLLGCNLPYMPPLNMACGMGLLAFLRFSPSLLESDTSLVTAQVLATGCGAVFVLSAPTLQAALADIAQVLSTGAFSQMLVYTSAVALSLVVPSFILLVLTRMAIPMNDAGLAPDDY